MPLSQVTRLARSCAYSAQAPEWELLARLTMPVVALAARRVCAIWGDTSKSTVSEIVQDTFLKICEDDRRVLREFEDRGEDSFVKLLRVITASVATDYFRRSRAEKRGGGSYPVPMDPRGSEDDVSDREATVAVEKATLIAQLDGMLLRQSNLVSQRDRSLFWLYYQQGLTAEAISRVPAIGLSAKGVESALARLTKILRETLLLPRQNVAVTPRKLPSNIQGKGFSAVIAIDSVKRR